VITSSKHRCDNGMFHAIRKFVTVQDDSSIRLFVPEFRKGTTAEVIILESSEPMKSRSLTSIIGKGRGCYASPEEVDRFIEHERNSWFSFPYE
jgi:hypothetical protein